MITPRCIIRGFVMNDAAELYNVLSDEKVMEYIEPAFTMEQTKAFIDEAGLCEPPLVYALEWKENHLVIGHVIFHLYEEDSYEIGWIINREYWGRGIADEVTRALIEYARGLDISSCVIECDTEQTASKHIALKNGFVYEGEEDGCDVYRLKLL
ncbi:MAG: GNAT family N-acetyltransferase [Lachnospiraceae bacterium]|nr:GNAT family N-acetyltransferase [Lachnospiraceae bacterium]